jgi:hypothetical protein
MDSLVKEYLEGLGGCRKWVFPSGSRAAVSPTPPGAGTQFLRKQSFAQSHCFVAGSQFPNLYARPWNAKHISASWLTFSVNFLDQVGFSCLRSFLQ